MTKNKGQSPIQSIIGLFFVQQAIDEYFRERNAMQFESVNKQIQTGRIDDISGVMCDALPSQIVVEPLAFTEKEKEIYERMAIELFALALRIPHNFL